MRFHVFLFMENTARFLRNLPRDEAIVMLYGGNDSADDVKDKTMSLKARSHDDTLVHMVKYSGTSLDSAFVQDAAGQITSLMAAGDKVVIRPSNSREYWDKLAAAIREKGFDVTTYKARSAFYKDADRKPASAPQKARQQVNAWSGFTTISPMPEKEKDEENGSNVPDGNSKGGSDPGQNKDEEKMGATLKQGNITSILDMINSDAQNKEPPVNKRANASATTFGVYDERDGFIDKSHDIPEPDRLENGDGATGLSDASGSDGDVAAMMYGFGVPQKKDRPDNRQGNKWQPSQKWTENGSQGNSSAPEKDVAPGEGGPPAAKPQNAEDIGIVINIASKAENNTEKPERTQEEINKRFMMLAASEKTMEEIPTKASIRMQIEMKKINEAFDSALYALRERIRNTLTDTVSETDVLGIAGLLRESGTPDEFRVNFRKYYGGKNTSWAMAIAEHFGSFRDMAVKIKL